MNLFFQFLKLRSLYISFLFLSLINIFFSTEYSNAKTFVINDIEISTPFEKNFSKKEIIDEGFIQAFDLLIFSIIQSKNYSKLKEVPLKQIKGMIDTFSIKEEKFIEDIYYLNLSVSFNKKNIFDLLEKKNIFPSLPIKKNVIFIPIIVDENNKQVKMFSENNLYNLWNSNKKKHELLNYILLTEDLEDFNLIKKNINNLENFEFMNIVNKYNIKDYIVAIIYKNNDKLKLLSKINFNGEKTLKNINLKKLDLTNLDEIKKFVKNTKIIYEDYWKYQNEINTSVKLTLTISVNNNNNIKINTFEKKLTSMDLVYNFYIFKFNNTNNFYKIIFNGTPDKFLELLKYNNYEFDTKNKIWVLK